MTPFLDYVLKTDINAISVNSNYWWCGQSDAAECADCPNDKRSDLCNEFTPDELTYLKSNHPELFI